MLRKLKIIAELKSRNADLEKLRAKKADFDKRKSDLETALAEAETEDDITLVSGQIDELEQEVGDANIDEAIAAEQAEIDSLNGELESINAPDPAPAADTSNERSAKSTMFDLYDTRTIFGKLTLEQRREVTDDADVRSFLENVRSLGGKVTERAVSKGELNIPKVFLGLIRPYLGSYSKVYKYVNNRPTKGESRMTIQGIPPEAVWTDQYGALNELDLDFGKITVDAFKVGGFIPVDNALLEDSDLNLAAVIVEGLAYAIGKAYDKAVFYGTGVRMPLGIASRLAQTAQPSDWDNDGPEWTDLHTSHILKMSSADATLSGAQFFVKLNSMCAEAYSEYSNSEPVWFMSRKTKSILFGKSVGADASAAIVAGMKNSMPVIGGEIVISEDIAYGDILGGHFDMYVMAERSGSKFARSEHVKFLEDQTVFKGSARYDGKPVFAEAFVLINILGIEPTTTATFAGDKANKKLVSLSELKIGTTPVTLFPPFNPDVLNYMATVEAHANKITAAAISSGAKISIKNGNTSVNNGSNATFTSGENILSITVTNGNAVPQTYTVTVTDNTT